MKVFIDKNCAKEGATHHVATNPDTTLEGGLREGEEEFRAEDEDDGEEVANGNDNSKQATDDFGWDKSWHKSYRDFLSPKGQLGRYLVWGPIQHFVSERVERAKLKNNGGDRGVAELFGDIIHQKYQMAQQQDLIPLEEVPSDRPIVRAQPTPKRARYFG
ncbi:hypothetical protein BJV82DRAFT_675556 [Fennellomyces sp. T-0311]|nr:hypothetical protein BJV82DRAFT_675556 [Fennellomyces sp. T-0311]